MRGWLAVVVVVLPVLAFSQVCPTVAVVIPETVIIQRIPRPIPDPAAETAVIRGFLKYGITVVELAHIRLLRATADGLAKTEDLARRALAGDPVAIRELAGPGSRSGRSMPAPAGSSPPTPSTPAALIFLPNSPAKNPWNGPETRSPVRSHGPSRRLIRSQQCASSSVIFHLPPSAHFHSKTKAVLGCGA